VGTIRRPAEQRFWDKVNKDGPLVRPELGPCWEWTGNTAVRGGYGRFKVNGKMVYAGRWYYERVNGPVLQGLELDHLCRNTSCVNPAHLEPVTRKENARRGLNGILFVHCKNGHPVNNRNTRRTKNGWRICRICNLKAVKRYQARKKGVSV